MSEEVPDSHPSHAIPADRSSGPGLWIMGAAVPLVLVVLGIACFVFRSALVSTPRHPDIRHPEINSDAEVTGFGLTLFGIALLLNTLSFDIGGRRDSRWSSALLMIGLLLLFGGMFSIVFG